MKRTRATAAYMNSIVQDNGSGEAVNGNQVLGETIADMGGTRVSLGVASDIEGFDYDVFFRSYARTWRNKALASYQVWQMSTDRASPELSENQRRTDPVPEVLRYL